AIVEGERAGRDRSDAVPGGDMPAALDRDQPAGGSVAAQGGVGVDKDIAGAGGASSGITELERTIVDVGIAAVGAAAREGPGRRPGFIDGGRPAVIADGSGQRSTGGPGEGKTSRTCLGIETHRAGVVEIDGSGAGGID